MSRLASEGQIEMPRQLPYQTKLFLVDTVCCIKHSNDQPDPNALFLWFTPEIAGRPFRSRKLCITHDLNEVLDFPTINAGSFIYKGKEAYFLLEKI